MEFRWSMYSTVITEPFHSEWHRPSQTGSSKTNACADVLPRVVAGGGRGGRAPQLPLTFAHHCIEVPSTVMSSSLHLWMRAESKPNERRCHLTPKWCRELVNRGCKVTVEYSKQRVFNDEEFESIPGVELVPEGSWPNAPLDAFILGIKELPVSAAPISHSHIYFAHAYKNQDNWAQLLHRFSQGSGNILDVEFLVDTGNRLAAAFPPMAGFCGMAVGISAWCQQHLKSEVSMPAMNPYDDKRLLISDVKSQLTEVAKMKGDPGFRPRIIVIGAEGRCGRGALEMAEELGIPKVNIARWDINETKGGGPFKEITEYDIFVNCVLLTRKIPPFLTWDLLDSSHRNLSVVVDVSCDSNNPDNPLPFYSSCTSFQEPTRRLELRNSRKPLDVVAIDNLPSLLPRESSEKFAEAMVPLLLQLSEVDTNPVWVRARQLFNEKVSEAEQILNADRTNNEQQITR